MKTMYKLLFILSFMGLLGFNSLSAQGVNTQSNDVLLSKSGIELRKDLSINLKYGLSESGMYHIDIADFASEMANDQTKVESALNQFERNHVSMEVKWSAKKAILTLERNATTSSWSPEQWNAYLQSK